MRGRRYVCHMFRRQRLELAHRSRMPCMPKDLSYSSKSGAWAVQHIPTSSIPKTPPSLSSPLPPSNFGIVLKETLLALSLSLRFTHTSSYSLRPPKTQCMKPDSMASRYTVRMDIWWTSLRRICATRGRMSTEEAWKGDADLRWRS